MRKRLTAAPVATPTNASHAWLTRPRPNPSANLRLFCFPYAGGGTAIFHAWPGELPAAVEVCSVHLPGRGSRLMEDPFTEMRALVRALAQGVLPYLNKPFAFFGHSMGAFIGFELARYLRRQHKLRPTELFVSAAPAPHLHNREKRLHLLPEREFIRELRKLNGTPQEVLESEELMQLMLPTLRADFTLSETYLYTYSSAPALDCPIAAFGGTQDRDVKRVHLEAWRSQTSADFSLHMLPGDHFFLHQSRAQLLSLLSRELSQLL
jgi:medium-chain acyl-[acyl-carrier-protein] hydrolase